MKTRLLIIFVIGIIAISIFLAYNQEIKLIMGMQTDDKPSIDTLEPLCPDGQTYNEILFKCVISCEADLVYNGYTNSCTTEFELNYHGFCNDGFTYNPSSHVCYSDNSQHTPLKDPPRTPPPEPEGGNLKLAELKESEGFIIETRTLRFPERTYTTLANHEDTKNEWFIVNGVLAFGSEMHEVIIPTTLDLYTDDGKVTSVMSYVSLEETIEYAKTLELDSGYIDLNDYVDLNWTDGPAIDSVEPEPIPEPILELEIENEK